MIQSIVLVVVATLAVVIGFMGRPLQYNNVQFLTNLRSHSELKVGEMFGASVAGNEFIEKTLSTSSSVPARVLSPVHNAVLMKSEEILVELIKRGEDVNALAEDDLSPLLLAVKSNNPGAVKILLKSGARTSQALEETGETSLHLSARIANFRLVKLLLDAGADVNIENKMGETALDIVTSPKSLNKDIATMLVQAGAEIKSTERRVQLKSRKFGPSIVHRPLIHLEGDDLIL